MKKIPHSSVLSEQMPFFKKLEFVSIIFVHIPKNAGTSIVKAINLPNPNKPLGIRKHYRIKQIQHILPLPLYESAFKFTFVRNPWDRTLSHYRFRKRKNLSNKDMHFHSFKTWLSFELQDNQKKGNLRPQIGWLKDTNGEILLDFIGRYENLENDFNHICEKIQFKGQLPHIEASIPKIDYRQYYDDEMREIVADYYKEDINYFNYKFE